MKKSFIIIALSILLLVTPVMAISGTIVNPIAVIDFELPDSGSGTLHRDIILRNTNDVAVMVTLDAQSDFEDRTTFTVNDIEIEAGGEKRVPFEVDFSQPGTYVGHIDAFFRNPADDSDVPAALRARYTVLVKGEGEEFDSDENDGETSADNEPAEGSGEEEAPRTFEDPDAEGSSVGFGIGGSAVSEGPLDPDTNINWFAISFIVLIVIAVVLGVIYALKK